MKDKDARVRLEAAKYYTARRMGWKETNVNEQVGKDGGPIETKDVSAIDIIRARIASARARLGDGAEEHRSWWRSATPAPSSRTRSIGAPGPVVSVERKTGANTTGLRNAARTAVLRWTGCKRNREDHGISKLVRSSRHHVHSAR
jgi:hypothetical protein